MSACVLSCNLWPALLAESQWCFVCYCVEQLLKVSTGNLLWGTKFCCFCLGLKLWCSDHKSGTVLLSYLSLPLVWWFWKTNCLFHIVSLGIDYWSNVLCTSVKMSWCQNIIVFFSSSPFLLWILLLKDSHLSDLLLLLSVYCFSVCVCKSSQQSLSFSLQYYCFWFFGWLLFYTTEANREKVGNFYFIMDI